METGLDEQPKKRFGFIKGTPEALAAGKKAAKTKAEKKLLMIPKLIKLYNDVMGIKEEKPVKPVRVKITEDEKRERKRVCDIAYNKTRPKKNTPEYNIKQKQIFAKNKVAFIKKWKSETGAKKSWVSIRFKKRYGITIPELLAGKEFILK